MTNIREINWDAPLVLDSGYAIIAMGDMAADTFGVTADRRITGYSCEGSFVRPDGTTIMLKGSVSGMQATVTLTAECCYYDGPFTLSIALKKSNEHKTVRQISGRVIRTTGDIVLDSNSAYSLSQLETLINGKLNKPAAEGAQGDVLTTDGAGGTSWEPVSAATSAGKLTVSGTHYSMRIGSSGAAGYITFVTED